MSVKLLTEHHLEFLSLKGACAGSSESYACQNATLMKITCHGSVLLGIHVILLVLSCIGSYIRELLIFQQNHRKVASAKIGIKLLYTKVKMTRKCHIYR